MNTQEQTNSHENQANPEQHHAIVDITSQPIPDVPEQEEISAIKRMFDRAANAIVDSSRLAKEVAELRAIVADLKDQVEKVRAHNEYLDEQITHLRTQRDEARDELYKVRRELTDTNHERDDLRKVNEAAAAEITHLRDALREKSEAFDNLARDFSAVCRERDDAYSHWQQAEGKANELQERHNSVVAERDKLRDELYSVRAAKESAESKLHAVQERLRQVNEIVGQPEQQHAA